MAIVRWIRVHCIRCDRTTQLALRKGDVIEAIPCRGCGGCTLEPTKA
jgi:hypothetical protein